MKLGNSNWMQVIELTLKSCVGVMGLYIYFFCTEYSEDALKRPVLWSMAIIGITLLWLFGKRIFIRLQVMAQYIYIAILVASPMLLFCIVELSYNMSLLTMDFSKIILNCVIYGALELLFLSLWSRNGYGLCLLYLLSWMAGTLNYFVMQFRGQPLVFLDIFQLGTAMSVADQYSYKICETGMLSFVIMYGVIAFICSVQVMHYGGCTRTHILKRAICSALSTVLLLALICDSGFAQKHQIKVNYWEQKETYETAGMAPGFLTYLQRMRVESPEEYSDEAVNDILEPYDEMEATEDIRPTIIVIMNEAFSDLSAMGPLQCTEEHLQFFHSLKKDAHTIEHGKLYVSTRGGGTSTTEFEFLTGNSISNTNGINPYASFYFGEVPNMARNLKNQGYRTIALHPESATNWKRNTVYPDMGFDDFLSLEDFENAERTVWNRVSDLGHYKKLIEVLEQQTGPGFLFNVTMQNHGGYSIASIPESNRVAVDKQYQKYTDFQAYESLLQDSDDALRYLMDYLRELKRPVLLCFFGDHQPCLDSSLEEQLIEAGKQEGDTGIFLHEKYYAVPYFIWSNYDIGEKETIYNEDGEAIISTNYLGVLVQKYAGLELSPYAQYLMEQRTKLPVVNVIGYYTEQKEWHRLEEETKYSEWLDQYSVLQYHALFD